MATRKNLLHPNAQDFSVVLHLLYSLVHSQKKRQHEYAVIYWTIMNDELTHMIGFLLLHNF
ncbi:MAG: hypothetical protein HKM94_12200 [Halobacteria archaeon]|nr:hypothetical protein [Halobacteria archaeon]